MIECCSNIFPIPLNPTKVCLRLIVVSRLTKWMIGMFGIHSTGLTCPWLAIGLSARLGTEGSSLSHVSQLSTNNMLEGH